MARLYYSNLGSALSFSRTFIPGGYVYPSPVYETSDNGSYASYAITRLNGSYYGYNEYTVRVSGRRDELRFHSDRDGTILLIDGGDFDVRQLSSIVSGRVSGNRFFKQSL